VKVHKETDKKMERHNTLRSILVALAGKKEDNAFG